MSQVNNLMSFEVLCSNDVLVRLEGDRCTVWLACGLPDHKILIDELEGVLPDVFKELIERKMIKVK